MSARSEWRHAALLALTVSDASRGERRLAQHLLDCMDALELSEARLADVSARNQWLGDAS